MRKELGFRPEEQLQILETLKPKLGRFIEEKLYSWGLGTEDILLVDEAGFSYTGIPVFGPELINIEGQAHIDIAIREEKYTGPRSNVWHPIKIPLPGLVVMEISNEYGIGVWDFIRGRDFFDLSTIKVRMGKVDVLVPEPIEHVKAFAEDTILNYTLEQMDEHKLKEWFMKLLVIRDVSKKLHKFDVEEVAQEMITLSQERWSNQGWEWLDDN